MVLDRVQIEVWSETKVWDQSFGLRLRVHSISYALVSRQLPAFFSILQIPMLAQPRRQHAIYGYYYGDSL